MATPADLQKTLKTLGLDFLYDILNKANMMNRLLRWEFFIKIN